MTTFRNPHQIHLTPSRRYAPSPRRPAHPTPASPPGTPSATTSMPVSRYRTFADEVGARHRSACRSTAPGPTRSSTAHRMWCAVDLRDGNQALIDPMSPARKRRMFDLLVRMGYKEIEVGFPSASQTDFDFVREIIDRGRDPRRRHHPGADAVPARADRADVRGVRGRAAGDRALLQLDVDPAAPRGVPRRPRGGQGDRHRRRAQVRRGSREVPGHAVALRVLARSPTPAPNWSTPRRCATPSPTIIEPTPEWPLIVNLPATVEMATPNVYADSIEWMSRNLARRDSDHPEPAPAQRPRNRRRRSGIGLPGRCRPDRGLPVRQRRAHRQRLHRDAGAEPVLPRRRPADRLLQHRRDPAHGRVLQPAAGARTPPVRRRPGVHRVLRQPPGRHQQGPGRDEGRRPTSRTPTSTTSCGRCRICRSTPRTSAAPTRPSSG